MRRRQIFVDEAAGESIVLPVTPPSYAWETAIRVEQVNIDALGDLNLAGTDQLANQTVECLVPAQLYAFCEPEARAEPYYYVQWFERRCKDKAVLRYIVSGTPLNAAVLLEAVSYAEDDGTNDVKAKLVLRQYRRPETPPAAAKAPEADALTREAGTAAVTQQSYTVRKGDTLSALARRFYGDASLYPRLYAANSSIIKNPNLIYPGQVLTIPGVDQLPAAKALPRSSKAAKNTYTKYDETLGVWRLTLDKEAQL